MSSILVEFFDTEPDHRFAFKRGGSARGSTAVLLKPCGLSEGSQILCLMPWEEAFPRLYGEGDLPVPEGLDFESAVDEGMERLARVASGRRRLSKAKRIIAFRHSFMLTPSRQLSLPVAWEKLRATRTRHCASPADDYPWLFFKVSLQASRDCCSFRIRQPRRSHLDHRGSATLSHRLASFFGVLTREGESAARSVTLRCGEPFPRGWMACTHAPQGLSGAPMQCGSFLVPCGGRRPPFRRTHKSGLCSCSGTGTAVLQSSSQEGSDPKRRGRRIMKRALYR